MNGEDGLVSLMKEIYMKDEEWHQFRKQFKIVYIWAWISIVLAILGILGLTITALIRGTTVGGIFMVIIIISIFVTALAIHLNDKDKKKNE